MNQLDISILNNCSGKTYKQLCDSYGEANIKRLIGMNYITVLENQTVLKTELGIKASQPITNNPTNEKFGQDGYQLIVDGESQTSGSKLLLS